MPKFPQKTIKKYYSEDLFLLDINQGLKDTGIKMKLFTPHIHTDSLPSTHSTLLKILPSVFHSKCFNDKNLAFAEEVKNTEIGHLFEHILIEYLTKLKRFYHKKNVSFSGTTSWDWTQDEKGVFNITISAGIEDASVFEEALRMSTKLLNKIVKNHSLEAN